MGFVETKFSEEGTVLNILIRGREIPAKVTKLPFVKT
jgi:glycine cleavage system aminomethyltransferase T